jgi:hypothetical protein
MKRPRSDTLCSAFYSLYLPIVPQFSTRLVSKSKQMPSLQFLFSSLYQFSATERKIEARSRISLRCSSHHFRIHHKHQDTIFLIRQVASCPRQYLRDSSTFRKPSPMLPCVLPASFTFLIEFFDPVRCKQLNAEISTLPIGSNPLLLLFRLTHSSHYGIIVPKVVDVMRPLVPRRWIQ